MDSIDITDSAFSLDVSDVVGDIIGSSNMDTNDYTMYLYIGAAILVIIIGTYIFNIYKKNRLNNNDNNDNIDCTAGFCMMNQQRPREI